MIKGVIFDLDGTLIDSMHYWNELAYKYLEKKSRKPLDDINEHLKFASIGDACKYYKVAYDIEDEIDVMYDDLCRMIADIYFEYAPLKEGVLDYLKYLKSQNIKMCVATATIKKLCVAALNRTEIIDYFSEIYSCEDIGKSKNSPDIFEIAASHLDLPKNEILVFEDSLHAIKMAKSLGFVVCGIYDVTAKDDTNEIKQLVDYYITDFISGKDLIRL